MLDPSRRSPVDAAHHRAELGVSLDLIQGKSAGCWKTTPRSGPGPMIGWPAERDAAGSRRDEAGEGLHKGGLAAARRADDADEIAGAEGEVDRVERVHRPFLRRVLDAEFGEFDERFGHVPDKLLPRLRRREDHRPAIGEAGAERRLATT